ncbi:hypothetical protein A1O3_05205 [Capronia epimyces CBS 606.96]|uniref:Spondin domain-containing protein n=1 Tax=Capronia epimyces CBS 606.96 TaxID=1182542 RepID=W9Y5P2_9EURO|nr:uncharacterized protein A1O3_05205 [Capronia epimyces CBS 606.96]EXJ84536.1 hypothetical protein A1O3_05205 [Capronia epimyces CBS 606.96]
MSSPTLSTVLFSALLAVTTTHAFIPVEYPPVPSDLDTNQWAPYTTLEPITSVSTPTATPSADVRILPVLDANLVPELKRQVAGADPANVATAVKQVSPITTYFIQSVISGSAVQVPIVYTQTFPTAWDQWPSATRGEIGLGTIQGTIGVVKSKRSLPTQAPLGEPFAKAPLEEHAANPHEEEKDEEQPEDPSHPLLNKLKKAGKEIQEEIVALLNKQKKPALLADAQPKKDDEVPLSPAAFKEEEGVAPLEKEQKKPGTQADTTADTTAKASDGRPLKAGILAVLAMGVATVCVTYL